MKDFKDLNIFLKIVVYAFHSLPFIFLILVAYKKPAEFIGLAIFFTIVTMEKTKKRK